MKDNDEILVLALAAELPIWLHVAGTKGGYQCMKCGAECVAAPTGQRWMRDHPDALVMCAHCILKDPQMVSEIQPPGTVPGQAEEVAQYFKEKAKQIKNARSN